MNTTTPRHVADPRGLPLDEQVAIFDEFVARAYGMALDSMEANHEKIVALARTRLASGFTKFGGEMFATPTESLHKEALEEYADAINYWVALMWKLEQRRSQPEGQ